MVNNKHKYQGLYKPKNPAKYIGDANNIVFRSLWERQVMIYLDNNTNVIAWNSEELVIPYISPVDGRPHRYFPDFWVKARDGDKEKILVLEVKPLGQTQPPVVPKKQTKRFLMEAQTYAVNMAKFEAATKFCELNGWTFQIITEIDLKLR